MSSFLGSLAAAFDTPQRKAMAVAVAVVAIYGTNKMKQGGKIDEKLAAKAGNKKSRGGKGNVDKEFLARITKLVKVVVPSAACGEAGILVILSVLLVLRTMLSIWLADVNGMIVKTIVNKDFGAFVQRIMGLFMFAIPSSTINSGLDYFQKQLSLRFRKRLTLHFHSQYLKSMNYYKICNLDCRITNPDQRLTADTEKWATSLSSLYMNLTKPVLDIVLFSKKLAELVGWEGPAMIFAWYGLSGLIIKTISPAFGRMTAVEQQLEGEYRHLHNELLAHSEEIAFYNGQEWEEANIDAGFNRLYAHTDMVLGKKFLMGIFDSMLVKYGATMVGYTVVGLPVFGPRAAEYLAKAGSDSSKITKDYVRNSSLLINLAKAIGRLVVSYKEIQSLAGYTSLINEMDDVLDDLKIGRYKRVMVAQEEVEDEAGEKKVVTKKGEEIVGFQDLKGKAKFISSDNIVFEDVPIISPNGDTLIAKMSFKIEPGMHLMIAGPNGCGKSSLFRILGELWPATGGVIHKPKADQIFYIPQRPYLPNGTLRDQLIYPDTLAQFKAKGKTDEDLMTLLNDVRLGKLVKREGGWSSDNDWNDVLSGGEKQRVAMARLLYHKPKYAILDECTSAVSIDVEQHLYDHMKSQGITLITISHRPTVWAFHEWLLQFHGDKEYRFEQMPADKKIRQ